MSEQNPHPEQPVPGAPAPLAAPLLPSDPPRIGGFWLDARLVAGPPGVAYLAHGVDGQGAHRQVLLVMLAHGAAQDAACRERLAGEVNKLHIDTVVARGGQGQDQGRLAHRFLPEADAPVEPGQQALAPWVALAYDGSEAAVAEAERLLRSVDLSTTSLLGTPSGPDYQLHWIHDSAPAGWRAWPLPWPGRTDRAGWISMLVSWLLMILLSALALLIAVLLFQNTPPAPPPPPIPTTPPPSSQTPPPSQSPQSGSPSGSPSQSGSGSPSPSQASPSQGSGSPSQSGSPSSGQPTSPSGNPSMESPMPSGSASGDAGSPTPNKRL
ncbi:hypothetical protein [Luteococcus japonicus]|uniref:hypothetical protein n=1 Tax=Luteococcus japonicus TaxID=33984 RepID=UPI000B9A2BDD|nr:hypothetical protein [Luteococcus japonicus]